MVLPVLRRIHCGIGRFCFCALASFCFVRKDLWLLIFVSRASEKAVVCRSSHTGILTVFRDVEGCQGGVGVDGAGF